MRIINSNEYFIPNQIQEMLNNIGDIEFIYTNKKILYGNIPISFDIETTSFYQSTQVDSKTAIMYEWTLNINGYTMIGRTWKDLLNVFEMITEYYDLSILKRLIIYVHNLSYEFQFIRKRIDWDSVFALDKREPVKAVSNYGLEFRCSYLLSGYSLDNLSNQLLKYKCNKKVGNLDYTKLRNSLTRLTEEEIDYCVSDCKVVVYYIQELIERLGDITKIPLTKTGFVRKHCRDKCLYGDTDHKKEIDQHKKYINLMKQLTLTPETYILLKQAFQGGFTHCSSYYSNETVYNVDSFDFTSSYPYVMVSEKFPMSKPERIFIKDKNDFINNINYYCCVFTIEFYNLEDIIHYENYISKSKCIDYENIEENNGRIVNADYIKIVITEQDFLIIRKMYDWSKMKITNFYRFKKAYLPTEFIYSILELYKDKTELKGVEGKESEYMNKKEMINSCYGMTVTDICRNEILYNSKDEWRTDKPDIQSAIEKYNKSTRRFLYYPWGIWVTAYARRNLFTGILTFGADYIYADTDSIKVKNMSTQIDYIGKYNENVIKKLHKAMDFHKLPYELVQPKTIKGEVKTLGLWEHETKNFKYSKFKSLGAKRYIYEQNCELHLTVSGVNKKKAIPYLTKYYRNDVFEKFEDGLEIPAEYTGKLTHTYIDTERQGVLTDYLGNTAAYNELSCVHLEPTGYNISLAETYADYLLGIKLKEK